MKLLVTSLLVLSYSAFGSDASVSLCPQGAENSVGHFVSRELQADGATGFSFDDQSPVTMIIDGDGLVTLYHNDAVVVALGHVTKMPQMTDNCSSYPLELLPTVTLNATVKYGNPYPVCSAADGFQCNMYRNEKSSIAVISDGETLASMSFDEAVKVPQQQ